MKELRVSFAEMLRSDLSVYRKLVEAGAPVKMDAGEIKQWGVTSREDPTNGEYVFTWE